LVRVPLPHPKYGPKINPRNKGAGLTKPSAETKQRRAHYFYLAPCAEEEEEEATPLNGQLEF
jgi:hypothetical protein